ncbi:hypothetical protein GWI33_003953 [Rhynchophorus ferrugineus]|uniref:Uncharacterized protein n=1 Tax=Rhynchophorus ferrugineus TaxID=354439 RepID=A0A834HLU6_RHYFE|nr:hypothetical protein GWI33_003953 [Rhynchophorus ferrugineus]
MAPRFPRNSNTESTRVEFPAFLLSLEARVRTEPSVHSSGFDIAHCLPAHTHFTGTLVPNTTGVEPATPRSLLEHDYLVCLKRFVVRGGVPIAHDWRATNADAKPHIGYTVRQYDVRMISASGRSTVADGGVGTSCRR